MFQINPLYELSIKERSFQRILEDMSNYIMIPAEDQRIKLEGLEPKVVRLTQFPIITNLNWRDFHEELSKHERLMPHLVDRLNSLFLLLSEKKIFDGNGKELDIIVRDKLRRTYLSDMREYLSTSFERKEDGLLYVSHGYLFKQGDFTPEYTSKLEKEVLLKDCIVNLTSESFNSQGISVNKSNSQSYKAGENIYYYHPIKGKVARLGAVAGWSSLDCDGDPSVSDVGLGACAKILGDI